MGQCASSHGKISVKKVMKNTITQFIDKTEYLVSSYDLLMDAYTKLKEEIFEIIHFGSNNAYHNYNYIEENKADFQQQQQRTNSDGTTEKSTIVVIMSLSSLPNIINNAQLSEKQQLQLIRVIERFQECVKCLRALRSSCCKALQRQEIGWQNYQIVQQQTCSSPKKCSAIPEIKSERASCGSPSKVMMASPSKYSKSSPLDNYSPSHSHHNNSHQKRDTYNIKREICARKLLLIIQNIDKLQQSYDFDYIIRMVKEAIINKNGYNGKFNGLLKNLNEEQIEQQIAAAIAEEQKKKQDLLKTLVKDLSESEII